MSTNKEQTKSVAYTQEELLNFRKELGPALKERRVLKDLFKDYMKPLLPDDVEEYLVMKTLCKQHLDRLLSLNDSIENITQVLVKQVS